MADDWHKCDAGITSYTESQPRNHNVEDGPVHIEQEDRKAGKEEEEGNVDKYWHSSGGPVKV